MRNEIQRYADQLEGHISAACGDLAGVYVDFDNNIDTFMLDPLIKNKLEQAKRDGIRDLRGWYAEELYDDADTLVDLIYNCIDMIVPDIKLHKDVLNNLAGSRHQAVANAALKVIESKEKYEWNN